MLVVAELFEGASKRLDRLFIVKEVHVIASERIELVFIEMRNLMALALLHDLGQPLLLRAALIEGLREESVGAPAELAGAVVDVLADDVAAEAAALVLVLYDGKEPALVLQVLNVCEFAQQMVVDDHNWQVRRREPHGLDLVLHRLVVQHIADRVLVLLGVQQQPQALDVRLLVRIRV